MPRRKAESKKLEPLKIKKRQGNPIVIFKGQEREMPSAQIEYVIQKYGKDGEVPKEILDLSGSGYTPTLRKCADC